MKKIKKCIMLLTLFFVLTQSVNAEFFVSIEEGGIVEITGKSSKRLENVNALILNNDDEIVYLDQGVSDENKNYTFKTQIDEENNLKIKIGGNFSDFSQEKVTDDVLYVSETGDDNNSGSYKNPLRTLEKAIEYSQDGSKVVLVGAVEIFNNISCPDKKIEITGGILDIADSLKWHGDVTFSDIQLKAEDVTMDFSGNVCFGENVDVEGRFNITGDSILTVKDGAFGNITSNSLYIYEPADVENIENVENIVFLNGSDFSEKVNGEYTNLIKSGIGGEARIEEGKIKIFPSDGRAYSVDNGEYSVFEREIKPGEHIVEYAYDFHLYSLKLDDTDGVKATISAACRNLNKEENIKPVVVGAVYQNEKLSKVVSKAIEKTGDVTQILNFGNIEAGEFNIKIFLWDSFGKMRPLTNIITEKEAETGNAFYVSTDGNDSNPGTIAEPFLTLDAAQKAARECEGECIVYFREGEYRFDSQIDFNAKDNDTTYAAYNLEKVTFTNTKGIPYSAFSAIEDETVKEKIIDNTAKEKVMCVNLSDLGITKFGKLSQLFGVDIGVVPEPTLCCDNKKMTLARYPNNGFLDITGVKATESDDSSKSFLISGDGFGRAEFWQDNESVWQYGYISNNWAFGATNGSFDENYGYNINIPEDFYSPKKGGRVYFVNLLEEIDMPGEWFLDRNTGRLYIYPPEDVKDNSVFSFTACEADEDSMFNIVNADNISFEGFVFSNIGGKAFDINSSTNISVSNCEFFNVLNTCINTDNTENCSFDGNYIHNVSAKGIVVSGGIKERLKSGNNSVTNNRIMQYAEERKTYSAAITLAGVGNLAAHNEISDSTHLAIAFKGQKHVMELNEIINVCTDTSDSGAVYSGRNWAYQGNIIRYNYFENIKQNVPGDYPVHSIYFDDCFSSAEVYGNVFYNCDSAGFIGGGRGNVFNNNVMINCGKSVTGNSRGMLDSSVLLKTFAATAGHCYQNDIWKEEFPLLYNIMEDKPGTPKYNVVTNNILCGTPDSELNEYIVKYGTVKNNISIVESDYYNCFNDFDNTDFGIPTDSAIYDYLPEFEYIPFNEMGIVN